ncbi:hypothetical protein AVEN_63992-1 [Araneus ventricosus]|uniref:H15 domain-containing protein n=1 Tax=Araneus ventricosus TaxID=182803 RepID=A0A4Y2TDP5_ARAVE|nr:hypothetical protein AVEN_63992-1 [Araneus ventricosus]
MDQNFASPAASTNPLQRPAINGNVVLQTIVFLQKLNGCSVNNLKKYLASHHGIDCQTLDAVIKPIMKMAMDRNILKNLGDSGKVAKCRKRKKSSRDILYFAALSLLEAAKSIGNLLKARKGRSPLEEKICWKTTKEELQEKHIR